MKQKTLQEEWWEIIEKVYNIGYVDGQDLRIPSSKDFPMVFDKALSSLVEAVKKRLKKKNVKGLRLYAGNHYYNQVIDDLLKIMRGE